MGQRRNYGGHDNRPAHRTEISPKKPKRVSSQSRRKTGNVPLQRGPNLGALNRLKRLQEEARLATSPSPPPSDSISGESTPPHINAGSHVDGDGSVVEDAIVDPFLADYGLLDSLPEAEPTATASLKVQVASPDPSARSTKYFSDWAELIPLLVDPLLRFSDSVDGGLRPTPAPIAPPPCSTPGCRRSERRILCIDLTSCAHIVFPYCPCTRIASSLISIGYFPTAPKDPQTAFSINLLDHYRHLQDHTSDSITSLAASLRDSLEEKGFPMLTPQGKPIDDPFRKGLGNAFQWYDMLRVELDKQVNNIILSVEGSVKEEYSRRTASGVTATTVKAAPAPLHRDWAADVLRNRCPACFGLEEWGRSLESGGDIHLSADGNFQHRHQRGAGNSPPFYSPEFFLPTSAVDAMGERIKAARKRPPRRDYVPDLPDDVVDACEKSFEAADETAEKSNTSIFDKHGVFGVACRHDIPIAYADIDTPGEQQKYFFALVEFIISLLPKTATIVWLYDIGCVISRSLKKYDILPREVTDRMRMATSVLHAYGHEWVCQIAFNPRLQSGMGLSDGEGTERLWSRNRKLIIITRTSSGEKRIYLIDRHASAIQNSIFRGLGHWIKNRLANAQKQQAEARTDLFKLGLDPALLREQWALQRAAQTSTQPHAPAQLRKHLENVIKLQEAIGQLEDMIQRAQKDAEGTKNSNARVYVNNLLVMHREMVEEAEQLYRSLNVTDCFPQLQGITFQFVHTLLLARDLKINIRQRLVGRFFEMARLDQASGGHHNPLGTKLHQKTLHSIQKRTEPLRKAIKKYNGYCETLRSTVDPSWNVAVPRPLLAKLDALKDDQELYEDVWVERSKERPPRWLADSVVRQGIRAQQRGLRCQEERVRLYLEADNLLRWHRLRSETLRRISKLPEATKYRTVFQQKQRDLTLLRHRWANPCTPERRWDVPTDPTSTVSPQEEAASTGLVVQEATEFEDPSLEELPISFEALTVTQAIPPTHRDEDDDVEEIEAPHGSPEHDDADNPSRWLASFEPRLSAVPPIDWSGQAIDRPLDYLEDVDWARWTQNGGFAPLEDESRWGPPSVGLGAQLFSLETVREASLSRSLLNDEVINGCSALLKRFILESGMPYTRSIVFSCYEIRRLQEGALPSKLWGFFQHAYEQVTCSYSSRPNEIPPFDKYLWIIPIHRHRGIHWTLAVVDFRSKVISHYDSLAYKRDSANDLEWVVRYCTILTQIGHRFGKCGLYDFSAFRVEPSNITPCQTNGYDCGVWVLAHIFAVLRGFRATGLVEAQMLQFRAFLVEIIRNMTTTDS